MQYRGRAVPPSLLELSKDTAIANVRYIANVGDMDFYLLKDILPHCNIEQLTRIETATIGRDLSPVTDVLWRRFYEREFGQKSLEQVVVRMRNKGLVVKWKHLFEEKAKERERAQIKTAEKLKLLYAENLAKKQSRQIRVCSKVPPSRAKRSFYGGSGPSSSVANLKGNLMKKAKLEYLNYEAAMRKNAVERTKTTYRSVSKSNNFLQRNSASSSWHVKPERR